MYIYIYNVIMYILYIDIVHVPVYCVYYMYITCSVQGWKNERVVSHTFDGRILMILPSDSKHHLKKVW